MLNILLFGDSISNGYGVSVCDNWSARISLALNSTYDGNVVIMNSSVNGITTRQALIDMPYQVQSHPPNVLIIQFGMNDCNCWLTDNGETRVSSGSFQYNLYEIINRAYAFGVDKVIMNTNHPTLLTKEMGYRIDSTYQKSNERYNTAIRAVAKRPYPSTDYIILNDIEKVFLDSRMELSELLLPDKLHPSIYGHDLYFNSTVIKIESVIDEII